MSDGTNSASAARAGDLPLDDAHRAHEEADRAKETFLIALCAGVTSRFSSSRSSGWVSTLSRSRWWLRSWTAAGLLLLRQVWLPKVDDA